jgi:hypothetical protein
MTKFTPLSETTPEQRKAIVEAAANNSLQNDTVTKRRAELIRELQESIRPTMTSAELRGVHLQITLLVEADKPRKAPPISLHN